MNAIYKLMRTNDDLALFVLRVTLGLVFFPHGAQKVLGWFGGNGFAATMSYFGQQGMPTPLVLLIMAAEFLGAIGLIVGLLTRVAAFGIVSVMLGAIFMVHLPFGFFMNWQGKQAGEGYEYHLLALAMALALMIGGAGRWSFDRTLQRTARDSRSLPADG